MDRDTVVRLAREAGFTTLVLNSIDGDEVFTEAPMVTDELTRFATLIANETLERAAKVCEDIGEGTNVDKPPKIAYLTCSDCANAIRALKE